AHAISLLAFPTRRSSDLPPLGIRSDLPKFLSLLSRQLFSVWAYDQSANQRRSLLLMDNAAPVAAKFAVLCRLPVVRSLFADVLADRKSTRLNSSHVSISY